MLTVFDLRSATDFAGLKSKDFNSAFSWSGRFNGERLSQVWRPLDVAVDRSGEASDPGDFPHWGNVPVFSQRGVDRLGGVLRACGELLPLASPDGAFYAYNITAVIHALDEKRSEVSRFERSERMSKIQRHAFLPASLKDIPIFKIPQFLTSYVFVTDSFVREVEACGLKGFKFTELWRAAASPVD